MPSDFYIKRVLRKVTAVRWLTPEAGQAYTDSNAYFMMGTGEGQQELSLWRVDGQGIMNSTPEEKFLEPEKLGQVEHCGEDVSSIDIAGTDRIVTGSDLGTVRVYRVNRHARDDGEAIEEVARWDKTHYHSNANNAAAPCTAVRVRPGYQHMQHEVASSGEDGRVVFTNLEHGTRTVMHEIDDMTITDLAWISPNQCVTTTVGGQIKLIDRCNPQRFEAVFIDSTNKDVAVNCVAAHPSQAFRIATGSEAGMTAAWDIRNTKEPVATLEAVHDQDVWQIMYHPGDTSKLISCSEDASVVVADWDTAGAMQWDDETRVKDMLKFRSSFNSLSVNCFDYYSHSRVGVLVCGTDSENLMFEVLESKSSFSIF